VRIGLTNLYNKRPAWLADAHRRFDEAVFAACGWPPTLTDSEILERLLALNHERAAIPADVSATGDLVARSDREISWPDQLIHQIQEMEMKQILAVLIAVPIATFVLAALPASAQKQYKVVNRVKLGGEGGWDYLYYDKDGHRLFITRGTHVMVVDTASLKVTADIPDLSGIHGVTLAPALNRGFISNGGDNSVTIFDLKTLAKLDNVKVGERPDAIMYDPFTKHVSTFNARSKDSTVLEAATGKAVGTVPLGGKPEFPASDEKGKVFVNIEDQSEIAEIDANKLTVLNKWPLAPCQEPSALAFDRAHHRLFAGCDNKMMAVVDSQSGKVVTTVPIGAGVDAGRFNANTQEVFMSCGEGVLTVIHEDSPDKYTVTQNLATAKGARTMAMDYENGVAYLVTAQREPTPPAPGQRPAMIPGTFELIVVKAE
jgi:YVTN family beta-propeller protein